MLRRRYIFSNTDICKILGRRHIGYSASYSMKSRSCRLAVLIDGDHINPADFGRIFAWAVGRGEVVIRRIYGNRKTLSDWRKCINNHRIEPVSNHADGRNAADFTMTIDAMDIFHAWKDVNGFCIITADNHFASLTRRLCKEGYFMAVLWSSNLNEPKPSFKDECNVFRHVDKLPPADDSEIQKDLAGWKDAVKEAIDRSPQEEGWVWMSDVGNRLKAIEPDFVPSDYCHGKLFSLIKSCPEFETKIGPERARLRPQKQ